MQLFNLPNILTLINLLAGCGALVSLFNYEADRVIYFMSISLVADFFDGMAARKLNINSPIGKELDSLADVISFGVVPSAIFYFLLNNSFRATAVGDIEKTAFAAAFPAFLIAAFAALRLAKFNTDERQTQGFIGLATPAATLFVVGLLEIYLHNSFGLSKTLSNSLILYGLIAVLCYLMIAEIPMFSFKFKNFKVAENKVQIGFIAISALLLVFFQTVAFPLIIILYIFASLFLNLSSKK